MTHRPRTPKGATAPTIERRSFKDRLRRSSQRSPRPRTGQRVGVRRLRLALGVYGLLALVVVGQLVNVQVLRADEFSDRSIRQRARTVDLAATRGRVYDREGDVLATSVQSATIYADPRAFRPVTGDDGVERAPAVDAAHVAATLAPLLGRDAAELEERLTHDAHFVYLARQLDYEVGEKIDALVAEDDNIDGLGVIVEPRREYPAGALASQVVGFTGIDGEGLQGLEAQYDPVLRGRPGMLAIERAGNGIAIASGVRELVPADPGTDLVLSLDREIQHTAERAAAAAVEEYDAAGAGVVVLEVGTGEVVGMASAPSYDPNARTEEDRENWRNRAVTDVFEPGSTQKALTMAAAIDAGVVAPDDTAEVADSIRIGGKTFTDSSSHPTEVWSMTQIMERSSNVGTIQVAQALGPARLEAYLRDFGYGRATGVGFPGEAGGLLTPHEQWWDTSLPTIAIGQGVAVTLLQLADSYATLANDGVAVQPRVVRGTVGDDGRLTPSAAPAEQRIVSSEAAAAVRSMLVEAVSGERGTGDRAEIAGYAVAGKTGTARKPSADSRGYSGEYVATFVGMAPAEDPRYVVAVMVDEPTPFYGGIVAAPVFRDVMEATLVAKRVPPDGEARSLIEALADADARVIEARATEVAVGE